jgi:hypothetical protein
LARRKKKIRQSAKFAKRLIAYLEWRAFEQVLRDESLERRRGLVFEQRLEGHGEPVVQRSLYAVHGRGVPDVLHRAR